MPDLSELIDKLLRWLEPYYLSYGYLLVFLGALTEHLFFLAWALPGGVIVALGGLYAQSGPLLLPLVIVLGAAGFVTGDHLDYLVGRRGSRLLNRVTKGKTMPASYVWSVRAAPVLILAYTNAAPRAAMFMGGAASGLSYRKFLMLSVTLGIVWSTIFSVIGFLLGSNRARLINVLQSIGIAGQVVIVTIVVVLVAVWYFRRRVRRRAAETD